MAVNPQRVYGRRSVQFRYLHFQPVIDELLDHPAPDNYLDYLRLKMRRIIGGKSISADVQKNTFSDDPDRDPEPVRKFACFTADLYRLAEWLRSCGVKTVAMQSTGVYWPRSMRFWHSVACGFSW